MERGIWDDPLARATRGMRMPSLDARSWDHPSHPLLNGLFEHPVRDYPVVLARVIREHSLSRNRK